MMTILPFLKSNPVSNSCFHAGFLLGSFFDPKHVVETSADFQWTARRYFAESRIFYQARLQQFGFHCASKVCLLTVGPATASAIKICYGSRFVRTDYRKDVHARYNSGK
jgi:hypothetical protein